MTQTTHANPIWHAETIGEMIERLEREDKNPPPFTPEIEIHDDEHPDFDEYDRYGDKRNSYWDEDSQLFRFYWDEEREGLDL